MGKDKKLDDKRKDKGKSNKKKILDPEKRDARAHKNQKLNLWPEENMLPALDQYREQKAGVWKGKCLSVRRLALKFGIPNSTLL